ncbi:lytic transglycosylase domain-containing protein [Erythrobacter sp. SCSIO 43205]|uniref:lytic transglycosylase domain-containing protein n=1 Tax=Erythrobacter sp. SCSIO 43205 TaxID=2779361 RepID=UPI001CA88D3A|nr:lytic transglycosylase domain-containing protein [Erythrobacter sp. SCSIO 43205]UAB77289.1 lytic transglycosylase domain-containing protein [Erythrobacter sp. SCSIO 43205]
MRKALAGIAVLSSAAFAPVVTVEASAQNGSLVAQYDRSGPQNSSIPTQLSQAERQHYARVFAAIDAENWDEVSALLNQRSDSILHQVALAEFYTHANSPKVSAEQISEWFNYGTHLPQAEQLGRLGTKRGLEWLPAFPRTIDLARQPGITKRTRPRSIDDGTMPAQSRSAILDAIRNDDPMGAYATLQEVDPYLSSEARAEWRQRVAWSFYIENDDQNALALAQVVSEGSGPWVAEGEWVAGLAAWRLGSCQEAADAFARAADRSTNAELTSAAHYWAHRSLIRCRDPQAAQVHLQNAARYSETLYGLLAVDQLGIEVPSAAPVQPLSSDEWSTIAQRPNVRTAKALVEIGRHALADEVLRHEARTGWADDYYAVAKLARELGLPSTQLFMANYAPRGMRADPSLRFPVAHWQPRTGWRVDPSLAFAHALQESNFRARAVSPANARGLMQIMPGTARDHNRRLNLGASYADLNDPEVNLAYGQQHLEMLRDSGATQGLLPKIMAAYNAGLTPVDRWNYEINDQGDPLLWMESIPYWETRGYVAIVMRNYWMYERAAGVPSPSRRALAQGQWPTFPLPARTRSARIEYQQ